MLQVYQQQQVLVNQANSGQSEEAVTADFAAMTVTDDTNDEEEAHDENGDDDEDGEEEDEHECNEDCGFCSENDISAASMWTKKDLNEFKDSIRKEGGDSIIKVDSMNLGLVWNSKMIFD